MWHDDTGYFFGGPSRVDRDFLLIARTDAIAVEGFERALERAEIYRAAGADVIFVEALNCEQLPKIAPRVKAPLLYNMAASGKTPFLTKAEIERLGFKLIIYPNWIVLAQIRAASRVLQTLKPDRSLALLTRSRASANSSISWECRRCRRSKAATVLPRRRVPDTERSCSIENVTSYVTCAGVRRRDIRLRDALRSGFLGTSARCAAPCVR